MQQYRAIAVSEGPEVVPDRPVSTTSAALLHSHGGDDRHAGPEGVAGIRRVVEDDFHRYALNHLDEISAGILGAAG